MRELVRDALVPLGIAVTELEEVHALVDGLALHVVLQPARRSPDAVREVLRAHLARLATSG